MSANPLDFALFGISMVACLYCILLSRRLARLQNMNSGLGAAVDAFTNSAAAMMAATKNTRSKVEDMARMLAAQIEEGERTIQRLDASSESAARQCKRLQTEAIALRGSLAMSSVVKTKTREEVQLRPRFTSPDNARGLEPQQEACAKQRPMQPDPVGLIEDFFEDAS